MFALATCVALSGHCCLNAQPAVLPPGWSIAGAPTNQRATLTVAGSRDVAVIAILPTADARTVVHTFATQPTSGFSTVQTFSTTASSSGGFESTALLRSASGAPYVKVAYAGLRTDGTTALAALYTASAQGTASFAEKTRILQTLLGQLRAGRSIPESTASGAGPSVVGAAPTASGQHGSARRDRMPTATLVAARAGSLPSNIEQIAFRGFGVDIHPSIVFSGGIICDCFAYAFGATDLPPLRAQHPGDFGRWRRRRDGTVEYLNDQSSDTVWSALSGGSGKPMPANWRTQGTYSYRSGGGYDGNTTYSVSSYTFTMDGRFTTGSTIASTATSGGASVFAGGESAKHSGRYQISGWILQLTFDDGTTVEKPITWQGDADVVWIGGAGYVRG
jgi:hypothetical protein